MIHLYTPLVKGREFHSLQSRRFTLVFTSLFDHISDRLGRFALLAFLGIGLLAGVANATDVYLAPAVAGTGSGDSWTNAKNGTTYLASLYVTPPVGGTHIYVKAGSYNMPNNPGGNLTILMNSSDDISLQGGFPLGATFTDKSGYDPIANVTTITGSSGSWVNPLFTSNTATAKTITIKGFTLLAGNATNNILGPTSLASNSATFAGNFIFTDVTSSNQSRPSGYGLFFLFRFIPGTSSLTLNNCYFANNSNGTQGGSVIEDYGHNGTGQIPVTINNSSFVNNSSVGAGGAWGGAISITANSLYNINNTYFCGNNAGHEGGAIGVANVAATNMVLNITRCTFYNNFTNTANGYNGGAIYVDLGSMHVSNSKFYNNYCTMTSAGPVAATGAGGAIAQASSTGGTSSIDNCVFYQNISRNNNSTSTGTSGGFGRITGGGAVALGQTNNASGTFTVTNNKFVGNYTTYNNPAFADALGGALLAQKVTISNFSGNLFYNNYVRNTSSLTNIMGSDFAAYGTGVSISNITSCSAQLAGTASYTPAGNYSFTAANTFNNTSDGGVGTPTSNCPTGINAVAVNVQGSVWNDADGNVALNGLETATNAGSVLYVNLVDATNTVIASTTVSAMGNYSLTAPASTTGLKLVLSTSPTATTPGPLPTNWVNTGESAGAGNAATQGTTLGQIELTTDVAGLTNQSFGIEQLPTPGSGTATVGNAGGSSPVTILPSAFTSTSPSTDTAPGSVTAIRITTFPSNVTSLTINGTTYTAATFPGGGLVVPTDGTGAPTAPILIDPTNDANPASFTFVAVDNAGKESTTWGTAMISFTGIPDLTPIIYALPSTLHNTTNITYVVDVVELKGVNSSGLITVKVTKDALTSMSFVSGATLVGGKSVQNSVWSFDNTDEDVYLFTTSASVVGGNKLSFGLSGVMSPGASTGTLTVSVVIVGGSGGEVRTTNNVDADKIDYFQQ